MKTFKQTAIEWAEEILAKQPKIFYNKTAQQAQELLILGSLLYDSEGNWLPQLKSVDSFEI